MFVIEVISGDNPVVEHSPHKVTTQSIMTLSIMTLSIKTFRIKAFSIMTLSIKTYSVTILSKKGLHSAYTTLGINDT
jgi:hypothetical protein